MLTATADRVDPHDAVLLLVLFRFQLGVHAELVDTIVAGTAIAFKAVLGGRLLFDTENAGDIASHGAHGVLSSPPPTEMDVPPTWAQTAPSSVNYRVVGAYCVLLLVGSLVLRRL